MSNSITTMGMRGPVTHSALSGRTVPTQQELEAIQLTPEDKERARRGGISEAGYLRAKRDIMLGRRGGTGYDRAVVRYAEELREAHVALCKEHGPVIALSSGLTAPLGASYGDVLTDGEIEVGFRGGVSAKNLLKAALDIKAREKSRRDEVTALRARGW